MIDWDDLRFVLAVARSGSALRAARTLNVNQTTVTRRIAHIEDAIGAALFESRQNGQLPTPLGQLVAAGAERVEAEVAALKSAINAQQRVVSGSIRFTSSEVFANRIVAPFLRSFRKAYPGIAVDLIADDRRFDLSRGEADVAFRAGSRPEGAGVVAQRLPDAGWAPYCSAGYADDHGVPADVGAFDGHAIVLIEEPMSRLPAYVWLARVGQKATVSTRSNSLTNLLSAVRAGLGIGMLPCFIGDPETDLRRCLPPVRALDAEVWLIVREDIKQMPHVRAFVDALAAHMASLRWQLLGEIRPAAAGSE